MPLYSFEELAKSNDLDKCDPIDPLNTLAILENYYRIFFALIRGNTRRVGLPLELAICIWQHAKFCSPYPNKKLSTRYIRGEIPKRAAYGSFATLKRLMKTPPLLEGDLNSLGKIEISVNFIRNHEKFHNDYWNRFVMRALSQSTPPETDSPPNAQKPRSWRFIQPGSEPESSQLATHVATPAGRKSVFRRSGTVNLDHEIWDHIVPGDRIEVSVVAHSIIVVNCGCEGESRVFKIWEPSYEMLRLV
ncbi:hypothetical protein BDV93DRAFT_545625 [Ceratobasidium sp. AG-I]|nr:hypothetical protein BDV93DRAFT_545625 [Ceratobasidium sp. AG-I]